MSNRNTQDFQDRIDTSRARLLQAIGLLLCEALDTLDAEDTYDSADIRLELVPYSKRAGIGSPDYPTEKHTWTFSYWGGEWTRKNYERKWPA